MTFEEKLVSHGLKVKTTGEHNEIRICCLFCVSRGETQDTKFRLGINTKLNIGSCFNCDYKSRRVIQAVLRKLNTGLDVEQFESDDSEQEQQVAVTLPDGFEYLDFKSKSWYHKKALNYLLQKREIPEWQIKAKKIGVTMIGKFAYRIIFPVVFNNELVGVVGRDFTDTAEPKYLNSTGPKYLYNCPPTKFKRDVKSMVLSEGIFKALKIERITRSVSCANLGHALTDTQLTQLKRFKYIESVVVWPDPDKIGIKGALAICRKLKDNNIEPYVVCPAPKLQADELSDKALKRIYKTNVTAWSWGVEQKLLVQACF